ncbi:amidase [Terrihabitans rhizophilus]|uniref:Indoleacetamide hydrolase n=1 Tax=Terrihabitans rhizophilus TaxID=3092662 RepID=A0ABU4RKK6_9HYPH|nr:amidase [Terrihabitans sp. PJ23]MDX6804738.1 amidase [Terrihabitans sp. PJ23]
MPITDMTARQIAEAVNGRAIGAVAIVDAFLQRIDDRNPALNALVCLDAVRSRAEAHAVDLRIAAGARLPLAGVPIIVKDNIWAEGWRITQGSRLFEDFVAPADAGSVARARAAGAVVIGIGACSEFACRGVTSTPLHGITRHPLDESLTPGGSSGGNASALAAGFAPLALGTDAGGSVRRPAAHCGVVGFKPTQGAIPYGPGFDEPGWDISVIGPMGRCVDDVALLFEVLADLAFIPDVPSRVGFAPLLGLDVAIDEDVAARVAAAVATLRDEGLAVQELSPAWPEGVGEPAIMPLQHAGLAALYGEHWKQRPDRIDPAIGAQIDAGLALTGVEVARALTASHRLRSALDTVFRDVDLLISPTIPCPAWPHGQSAPASIGGKASSARGHAVFTPLLNHVGVPAISIPCGTVRNGLPIGLQIIGPRGADIRVLAAAAAAERCLTQHTNAV